MCDIRRRMILDLEWQLSAFESDPEPPRWLVRGCGEAYCYDCAVIERGFEAPVGEVTIDGGWTGEEDHCLHCERCGCLLSYSLTDYGVRQEMGHYFENPPRVLTPGEAYHICRMLSGAAYLDDVQADALAVARLAVAAIRALPAPTI